MSINIYPMTGQEAADYTFLALTVYREASNQPYRCKLAVAHSILTRVRHPGWWGHDLMSVIFARRQYTSMTVPGDPNLIRWPGSAEPAWRDSLQAALEARSSFNNPAPDADSYHDISIDPPKWATPERFVVQIGRIRFYKTRT